MKAVETISTGSGATVAPGGTAAVNSAAKKRLRLWPAVFIVAAFWIFHFGCDYLEMSMGGRFMTRFAFYGIVVLAFLVWWLAFSRAPWKDRLAALAALVIGTIVAGLLADKKSLGTMGPAGVFLSAFPFTLTVWAGWLLVSQDWLPSISLSTRRIVLCALIFLSLGFFDLVRWEGLDGGQHAKFAWRWAPSSEQLFLNAHRTSAADTGPKVRSIELQPGDWPEFRGPQRNSQVVGQHLATDWTAQPPKQIWRHRVGPGWSSMIVVDGRLFTQEQRGDQEAVVCYDAATGAELWAHSDDARFEEPLSQAGPRGTPTFAGGKIFALGATGKLNCLDAATGEVKWSHDIDVDADAVVKPGGFGLRQWGYSNSPLVTGGMVVVFAGGEHDKNVLAYDAATGDRKWMGAAGKDGYSSPQLVSIGGGMQLVMHTSAGLRGLDLTNGQSLWDEPTTVEMFVPITQPQPIGNDRLVAQSENGIQLVKLTRDGEHWSAKRDWESKALKPSLGDYVIHDGSIYGFDDGVFCCLDAVTGTRRWKAGRYGHGQVLLVADQGLLVVTSETGEVILLTANPKKLEELGRFQAIEGKTWNHPVLAHDKLFVRNGEEMACYELPIPAGAN